MILFHQSHSISLIWFKRTSLLFWLLLFFNILYADWVAKNLVQISKIDFTFLKDESHLFNFWFLDPNFSQDLDLSFHRFLTLFTSSVTNFGKLNCKIFIHFQSINHVVDIDNIVITEKLSCVFNLDLIDVLVVHINFQKSLAYQPENSLHGNITCSNIYCLSEIRNRYFFPIRIQRVNPH